ncbi:MAG: hypothetical protein R3C16_03310 [Hyphomonadaceae bacterium]
MRTLLSVIAVLALAACEPAVAPDAEAPGAETPLGEATPLPDPLPPPGAEPRYVGLWAVNTEMCAEPAWRFEPEGVSTLGEVSCSFDDVSEISAGYAVAATCHAEGTTSQHQMQLTFAESARAMMVTGGPWEPAPALIYCSPLISQ